MNPSRTLRARNVGLALSIVVMGVSPLAAQVQPGAPATAPATAPTTAPAAAVDAALHQAAHAQGQACGDALLAGDFKTLIRFTHPKIIEMVGGVDAMIATLEKGEREMKTGGMRLTAVTIGAPLQIITTETAAFAVLPQRINLALSGGQALHDSFLLGHSTDRGATWTFVDGTGLNDRTMKLLFPDAPADLKLPAKQKPTFISDK
ncbi:MAG TPA: hypothetical protein VGN72_10200 [Tepidisphaeraceae bacterium]|nr:hypothetical protein [Tepidisphaeraceae bacterium]